MAKTYEGKLNAQGFKFAVIASRFNHFISDRLLEGALDALERHGAETDDIEIWKVPGAFEIPLLAKQLADSSRYNGIVCVGAVIRGGTPHFEYVSSEVAKGIAQVMLDTGVPIAFGVLTTDSVEQAVERAGTKAGNKGWSAALSIIEMVNLAARLVEVQASGE